MSHIGKIMALPMILPKIGSLPKIVIGPLQKSHASLASGAVMPKNITVQILKEALMQERDNQEFFSGKVSFRLKCRSKKLSEFRQCSVEMEIFRQQNLMKGCCLFL